MGEGRRGEELHHHALEEVELLLVEIEFDLVLGFQAVVSGHRHVAASSRPSESTAVDRSESILFAPGKTGAESMERLVGVRIGVLDIVHGR